MSVVCRTISASLVYSFRWASRPGMLVTIARAPRPALDSAVDAPESVIVSLAAALLARMVAGCSPRCRPRAAVWRGGAVLGWGVVSKPGKALRPALGRSTLLLACGSLSES